MRAQQIMTVRPVVTTRDRNLQDVAELMGMTKQAASKLLDAMEGLGYIRRLSHEGDARAKVIGLTPRGMQLLETVEEIYRELEAEWAAILGAPQLEALRRDLTAVLKATNGGVLPAVRPTW